MILTGATNTDIEVCNVDLKSTNETDLNCTELMPLHSSTPQVCFVWRFHFQSCKKACLVPSRFLF